MGVETSGDLNTGEPILSISDLFPRTCKLEPELDTLLSTFSWAEPDLKFLMTLWDLQAERRAHLPAFWAWTDAMISDMADARGQVPPRGQDAIDCARFITCILALRSARSSGRMGECYDWIWTALSPTHVRGECLNRNTYSFINFPDAPRKLWDLYLREIPTFATVLFYVAYRLGGLDELTVELAPGCWFLASKAHEIQPGDENAIQAMIQMVHWAALRKRPEGPDWAKELLAAGVRTESPRQRLGVALTFTTQANEFVDGSPQEWADRALNEFGEELTEHERLQTLIVSLKGLQDWIARRTGILNEIRNLRNYYIHNARPGESDLEVLELRVPILHPLIFVLSQWGEVADIVAVIGAWYRRLTGEPSDSNSLAVLPTINGGVTYVWPGGRLSTGTGSTEIHDAMQRAAGTALGDYFRGSDGDHSPEKYEDFRFDVVNAAAGQEFEKAIIAHYRFDLLREKLNPGWKPRSVLVFPSGSEPLQAMLSKSIEIRAPQETSFEKAQSVRPIRRVSVWAGGPWHESFEIEAIEHIAKRAGWLLDIHRKDNSTSSDLKRFYEDDKADVLWVISHGAHDRFATRGTGLHLPDETLVDLEEIRKWRTPEQDRRLLVLNSCSGAAAQGRGGLARIGLAQSLVGTWQAVVGHQWPIHWTAGLAFGASLAAVLEREPSEHAALTAAGLMQRPDELMGFLEDSFAGCTELLDRLRRSQEDLSSITNWGCPVLLT